MADAKGNPYNTRKTKATTQDSDDEDQPLTQMEEQTKEKRGKRGTKGKKQDDILPQTTKKQCVHGNNNHGDPTMYVIVKSEAGNKIFQGMDLATGYIQNHQGCHVTIHMEQQAALEDFALPFIKKDAATPTTTIASTVTPNKQETNKIQPFSPVAGGGAARRDTDTEEKPEFIDMNKLEQQQQQAFDNSVAVIQPFQPPEDQREQIEREIQESIQTTKCTLQFMYFLVNEYIVVAVQFLNAAGKPYWCWKTEAVAMAMAKNLIMLPTHPAMGILAEFPMRKERNGSNEPKTTYNKTRKSNFEIRALCTNFRNKNWDEPIAEQVKCLAIAFESYIKSEKFPSYYIWALPHAHGGKIVNSIQHPNHEFWKDIRGCTIEVVNGHHLDSLFMDRQIMNFANCLLPHDMKIRDWSFDLKRQLYRSGEIPASFFA